MKNRLSIHIAHEVGEESVVLPVLLIAIFLISEVNLGFSGQITIVDPTKLFAGSPLGKNVKFLFAAVVASIRISLRGSVSCKITCPAALTLAPVRTIQPSWYSDAVQFTPSLLGQNVTGELSRTASERANCSDDVKSFTAVRRTLLALSCDQLGVAIVITIAIMATTTMSSINVKPDWPLGRPSPATNIFCIGVFCFMLKHRKTGIRPEWTVSRQTGRIQV